MNLFACLGVGPGNVLLLGPMSPGVEYRSPMEWRLFDLPEPREPKVERVRRSKADTDTLRRRVISALGRGELAQDIAARERISRPYVQWIKTTFNAARRTFRRPDENDALVAKAHNLMSQFPSMKRCDIATQCGLTPSNLSNLLARRAGRHS